MARTCPQASQHKKTQPARHASCDVCPAWGWSGIPHGLVGGSYCDIHKGPIWGVFGTLLSEFGWLPYQIVTTFRQCHVWGCSGLCCEILTGFPIRS